jgi:hypothetical protein
MTVDKLLFALAGLAEKAFTRLVSRSCRSSLVIPPYNFRED